MMLGPTAVQTQRTPPLNTRSAAGGFDCSCRCGRSDGLSRQPPDDILFGGGGAPPIAPGTAGAAEVGIGEPRLRELREVDAASGVLDVRSDLRGLWPRSRALSLAPHVADVRVKVLYLEQNDLGDEDAPVLAQLAVSLPSLTLLGLGDNCLGDEGVKLVADGLASRGDRLAPLQVLGLSRNRVGDLGAAALADAMAQSSALEAVDLRGNRLTFAGAQRLAEALEHCFTIRKLLLGGNAIGDGGARHLADMLGRGKSSLEELGLEENGITDIGAGYLAEAVRGGSAVRTLVLRGNPDITEVGRKKLQEVRGDIRKSGRFCTVLV